MDSSQVRRYGPPNSFPPGPELLERRAVAAQCLASGIAGSPVTSLFLAAINSATYHASYSPPTSASTRSRIAIDIGSGYRVAPHVRFILAMTLGGFPIFRPTGAGQRPA
jgi:hypothetical protein